MRHADRSSYSHFRAVDLPVSRCAAAQPRARHEKNTTRLFASNCKAVFPPGRPLRNARSRIKDSACVSCAIAPWQVCSTCCVFIQGQAALPRSVGLGGEVGLQALQGKSCGGSGQGQADQDAPQFLSHVHSNRTNAVPCGCGRAVSFSRQVFKHRHCHSIALVSVALGIFICVSAGWLARVSVCDRWGGLWRQTCAFPHACFVHSSFCVFFFLSLLAQCFLVS